ncbi:VIT-domain-containing protein [Acephala macrosclerotiorum]|nr:VIT-domain-containing protein [Acephala macrosclerotiorum]
MSSYYTRSEAPNVNRLASGLFFRAEQAEQLSQPPTIRSRDVARHEVKYDEFVVPEYRQTKEGNELYLPLLEVSVEVETVSTIAWTKLTQTFTNRATFPIKEATYCFPLYDKSTVTSFTCSIGSEKILKGVVKPKSQAKAEFMAAVSRQRVAALLEEHTPEIFETSVGNILAQSTVKIEICYITELKADLSGDGILLTIPTSVAPRYGAPPSSFPTSTSSKPLAVPPENGLQIQIQVSSPVAINTIESRTHPVRIEMGSHGHTTTRNIRDLAKKQESLDNDPKKARATLSDRSACLGKDFVLLIQSRGGTLLASRATQEPHPKLPNHSALMVSINLRDMYTPDVVSPKSPSEIIFFADRSGSMQGKIQALRTAMGFFLKSLPSNCSFNICSFGTDHILMWPESREYSQENLDEAMSYITTNFDANMGGTELLSGLRNVVQKSNPAFSTQIIIFTDGEVWNSANTFEFIRDTRSAGGEGKIRFFALGIGDAVSHHLVEGIGRDGGGLAEVVSVDSAGEWKGRVIRMLEAALTPSTWKVEVNLCGVPSTANGEERICIQAPHHIPDFHAFSRSSVYFLLSKELEAKSVKVKATATSGEIVTAELSIERLDHQRTYVHLLAAKAALNDLESGQSWLHAISQSNKGNINVEVEDLARAEGEKICTEWSLLSKWTSFVVVDSSNSLEKSACLYQAEKTDLSDLTRTRFSAPNKSFSDSLSPALSNSALHGGTERISPARASRLCASTQSRRGDSGLSFCIAPISKSQLALPGSEIFSEAILGDEYYPQYESLDLSPKQVHFDQSPTELTQQRITREITPKELINAQTAEGNLKLDSELAAGLGQQRITKEITLEELIDAQTAEGSFKLDPELATALKNKFKHWRFDLLVSEMGEDISLYMGVDKILETARAIVLIEATYTESCGLWRLVVQKANGFVATVILDNEQREKLFRVLKNQLLESRKIIDQALLGDPWLRDHREEFGRILRSRILDDPDELLRILRRDAPHTRDELIRTLGSQTNRVWNPSKPLDVGKGVEDPDTWTDGWDDILKVSKALELATKKKNTLSSLWEKLVGKRAAKEW